MRFVAAFIVSNCDTYVFYVAVDVVPCRGFGEPWVVLKQEYSPHCVMVDLVVFLLEPQVVGIRKTEMMIPLQKRRVESKREDGVSLRKFYPLHAH